MIADSCKSARSTNANKTHDSEHTEERWSNRNTNVILVWLIVGKKQYPFIIYNRGEPDKINSEHHRRLFKKTYIQDTVMIN